MKQTTASATPQRPILDGDIESIRERLKELEDKLAASERSFIMKTFDEIRLRKMAMEDKVEEMRIAGENATKELKAGFEMAWDDLKATLESAVQHFKH